MFGISRREATLILFLLFAVMGFAVYRFVYVPKTAELNELYAELDRTNVEMAEASAKIAAIPSLKDKITAEFEKANEGSPLFFNNIPQESLIVYLVETAGDIPVSVDSYSFEQPEASEITKAGSEIESITYDLLELTNKFMRSSSPLATESTDEAASAGAAAPNNTEPDGISDQIGKVSVSLSFSSTYEDMMYYLEKLEDYEKEILVNSLNATAADNGLEVSLSLEFYQLSKLFAHQSDYDFEQWRYNSPKGKINPFSAKAFRSGETGPKAFPKTTAPSVVSYKDSDFFLTARPASSGLPVMTVGYVPDETGDTYIRSYIEKAENVTVELTEQDGKCYYRFETDSGQSYPESGAAEFMPINEDIRLIVYSSSRLSADDISTTNLTIVNNTGRELNWAVAGDDTERPRISVAVR